MVRLSAIAGLVVALAVPFAASAETIFEQRLDTIGNRVEGLFTNDRFGHTIESMKDQRRLNISLLRDHQAKMMNLLRELEMIEADLARLVDGYVPVDHRCVELGLCRDEGAVLTQPGSAIIAPPPVTSCILNADGTIGACNSR